MTADREQQTLGRHAQYEMPADVAALALGQVTEGEYGLRWAQGADGGINVRITPLDAVRRQRIRRAARARKSRRGW